MTDISVTATAVVAGTGARTKDGTCGVTIERGQMIVLDPSTQKYALADSNHATAALRIPDGMALNGGAVNQPVKLVTAGPVTINAVLTAGTAYSLSDTPGGICPFADVGSGEQSVQVGVAQSTTSLLINIVNSGATL